MQKKSADDVEAPAQDPAEGSRQVIDHDLSRQNTNKRSNTERPSYWPKPAEVTKLKGKDETED